MSPIAGRLTHFHSMVTSSPGPCGTERGPGRRSGRARRSNRRDGSAGPCARSRGGQAQFVIVGVSQRPMHRRCVGPGPLISRSSPKPSATCAMISRGYRKPLEDGMVVSAIMRHVSHDSAPALLSRKRDNALRRERGILGDTWLCVLREPRIVAFPSCDLCEYAKKTLLQQQGHAWEKRFG